METPSHNPSGPRDRVHFPSDHSLVDDLSAPPTFEVIETLPVAQEPLTTSRAVSPFVLQTPPAPKLTESKSLPYASTTPLTLTELTQQLTERASPFLLVKKPQSIAPKRESLTLTQLPGPLVVAAPSVEVTHVPLRTAIREDQASSKAKELLSDKPSTGQWCLMWFLVVILLSLIVVAYDLAQQKGEWIELLLPDQIKAKIPYFGGEFEWPS